MSFFTTSALTLAVHTCLPEIDAVANRLPHSDAVAFREACRDYDKEKANQIIDNALKTYLKSSEVLFALVEYCKKFGISADIYGKRLPDILLFIASQEADISRKLSQKGIR